MAIPTIDSSPRDTLPYLRPKDGASCPTDREPLDFELDVDGETDRGCRRERNEDQFLIADLDRFMTIRKTGMAGSAPSVKGAQGTLMLVADGMGGHGAGDLASAVATDTIIQYVMHVMPWFWRLDSNQTAALLEPFQNALEQCQERLEEVAARKGIADQHPGTTLTMAYVTGRTMHLLHAGDSRCYLHRAGRLTRLTRDHTLAQKLADTDREGTSQYLARSHLHHILFNAIGGSPTTPRADTRSLPLSPGDTILLCSDGLTNHIDDEQLAEFLAEAKSASQCCRDLIAAAKAEGGRDNITAVVCRV